MSLHHLLHIIHHHLTEVLVAVTVLVVLLIIGIFVLRRRPRKVDPVYFAGRWHELQKHLPNKSTWPEAILDADKLLDEALKCHKFKGKSMGERLVSAQHALSSNDTVWFGHKLHNKLVHEQYKLTSKTEVKNALLGYLQALKDLGALKNDK
jgi:hypothetical protein